MASARARCAHNVRGRDGAVPSRSCTSVSGTPALTRHAAQAWRRSWMRTAVIFARFQAGETSGACRGCVHPAPCRVPTSPGAGPRGSASGSAWPHELRRSAEWPASAVASTWGKALSSRSSIVTGVMMLGRTVLCLPQVRGVDQGCLMEDRAATPLSSATWRPATVGFLG